MSRQTRKKGFTLIKLLVVIAITGGCGSKTPILEGDSEEVIFLKKAGGEIKIMPSMGLGNLEACEIDLTDVELTDEVFENLNAVSDARTLKMTGQHVTDEHVFQLGNLQRLISIDLTGARITDESVRHLVATMPHLKTLNLSSTQVTIEGIKELQKIPLIGLLLNFVPIGDNAVDEIIKIKTLRMVAVVETDMTTAGKNRLKAALPGRFVMVGK